MAAQEKISVYSLTDLKNTSDDAIPNYLNSLKFNQSHYLSDVRLGLGYTAFAICAATFYWDYKLGHDATKTYTAIAVAIYAVLNGALSFWIWGVEKSIVYVGYNATGNKIEVSSTTTKHIPIYNLTIKTYKKGSLEPQSLTISRPFKQWFDANGTFTATPFQQMFASNVEMIGAADPKRVVKEKKLGPKVDDGKSADEKWASLLAESSSVDVTGEETSSVTPSKGKKRSKKVT